MSLPINALIYNGYPKRVCGGTGRNLVILDRRPITVGIVDQIADQLKQSPFGKPSKGYPAVVKALRPEDWADIALQLADRYGPPSQPDFEEQFSTLHRNILEMEHEAQAERPD